MTECHSVTDWFGSKSVHLLKSMNHAWPQNILWQIHVCTDTQCICWTVCSDGLEHAHIKLCWIIAQTYWWSHSDLWHFHSHHIWSHPQLSHKIYHRMDHSSSLSTALWSSSQFECFSLESILDWCKLSSQWNPFQIVTQDQCHKQ